MFAAPRRAVAFSVTIKEAEGVSPFKPIENKEPLSETKIKQKLEMAEERRLVCSLLIIKLLIVAMLLQFCHSSVATLVVVLLQPDDFAATILLAVLQQYNLVPIV